MRMRVCIGGNTEKKRFNDGKDVRKWNHKAYTNERYDVSGWQSAKYTI